VLGGYQNKDSLGFITNGVQKIKRTSSDMQPWLSEIIINQISTFITANFLPVLSSKLLILGGFSSSLIMISPTQP
jgi:hypothetical protein